MHPVTRCGITEFGQAVGLAPPEDEAPPTNDDLMPPPPVLDASERSEAVTKKSPSTTKKRATNKSTGKKSETKKSAARKAAGSPRLPIAGYDDLTAREVISLVEDLTPAQRKRLRNHEVANRNRKTILAKLDRLDT